MGSRSRDFRDRGWAWVVLGSSFACHLLLSGPYYGAGLVGVVLKETFDASLAVTSLSGALLGSLTTLLGPMSSFLVNKIGWRLTVIIGGALFSCGLVVTSFSSNIWWSVAGFGFLSGIGAGMFYTASYVAVGYYFDKRRTLATGFACSGMGPGLAVFPPLLDFLFNQYSWRGALLILGGVVLNVCIAGALLRPIQQENQNNKDELDKDDLDDTGTYITQVRIVSKTGAFHFLNAAIFFIGAAMSSISLHLPLFAVDRGLSFAEAGFLTIITGITMVTGRFLIPLISQRLPFSDLWTLFCCLLLTGVVTITLPFCISSNIGAGLFAAIYGLCGLVWTSFYSELIVEFIGLNYMNTVYGINMFCYGMGSVTVPPAIGALVDFLGVYDCSFFVSGLLLSLSAFMLVPVSLLKRRQRKKTVLNTLSINIY